MILNPPEQVIFNATEVRMKKILENFRKDAKDMEFRTSGKVTSDLLSPVRIPMEDGKLVKLEDVATVGVRDGTALVITVFDDTVSS
jgi:ribosome recycling factor